MIVMREWRMKRRMDAGLSAVSGAGRDIFFTVNLLERRLDLLLRHVDALRVAVPTTRMVRPFHIDAWVVLPDHMHCVWILPPGDDDYSNRWKSIKIRFVHHVPRTTYGGFAKQSAIICIE